MRTQLEIAYDIQKTIGAIDAFIVIKQEIEKAMKQKIEKAIQTSMSHLNGLNQELIQSPGMTERQIIERLLLEIKCMYEGSEDLPGMVERLERMGYTRFKSYGEQSTDERNYIQRLMAATEAMTPDNYPFHSNSI